MSDITQPNQQTNYNQMVTDIRRKGKEMSKLFGTPELKFGPTLSSGLAPWAHELKLKSGDNVKFVPLHPLNESFSFWMHRKQVQYDGGFKYVPSGKKLDPPVESPFDSDRREEVRAIKPLYYMLVLVLSGTEKLNGHVAYLELRQNLKKRDGTFDRIAKYEDDSESGSVEGIKCSLSRTGSKLTDTVYESSITDKYNFKPEEKEVIEKEVPEIVAHLKGLYVKDWTTEEFTRIYNQGVVNGVAPKPTEEERAKLAETPMDDNEIPF